MRRRNINERLRIIWLGARASKTEKEHDFKPPSPESSELLSKITSLASQLESRIGKFDISKLLAMLGLLNIMRGAEKSRGTVETGFESYIEYMTALALKNISSGHLAPNVEDVLAIQDTIARIFWLSSEYCANSLFYSELVKDEETWNILMRTRLHYMIVRGETYDTYFLETAYEMFAPHARYLEQKLGFNISQAIGFAKLISALFHHRFNREKAKLSLVLPKSLPVELRNGLKADSLNRKQRLQLEQLIMNNLLERALDIMAVRKQELLNKVTANDRNALVAFLNIVSITPGEVDKNFMSPLDYNPILEKPLVQLDQVYLCHLSGYLPRWLVYSLDIQLRKDPSYLEKYNRTRSQYLEREALETFQKIFPKSPVYHRLKYHVVENGVPKEPDLDGLVLHDSNLFLIECATHPVTKASRKGIKEPIMHDVQRSIVRTFDQAMRAKKYIQEQKRATFHLADGSSLTIDSDSIRNYFLISVTLDSFDILAADPRKLRALGLFPEDEFPWPVYLNNLKLMADFIEFPSQFVHYLKQRMHVSEMVYASDEIDYFGCYFISNLEIPTPKVAEPIEKILIVSATSDFDEYFLYRKGLWPRVPKPGQYIPRHLKSIMRTLERTELPGYTDIVCMLLDMNYGYRKWVNENISAILHRSKESKGDLKDFTIIAKDYGFGFTYFCGDGSKVPDLAHWLPEYCIHKMNESSIYRWVGFARDTSVRKPFVSVFFCNGDREAGVNY